MTHFVVAARHTCAMLESSGGERELISTYLRHARGRYNNDRASQLSGVPSRTLYDWRKTDVFPTDYPDAKPAGWSYRDLVLLRLLAWLRQAHMNRRLAADWVATVRAQLSAGVDVRHIHASSDTVVLSGGPTATFNDDSDTILPFTDFHNLFNTFTIADPIKELRSRGEPVWAPDLLRPSTHSTISPWVMAGEPCIRNSRIPTAAIFALRTTRNLPPSTIVELYPALNTAAVDDVVNLERRLRRVQETTAA